MRTIDERIAETKEKMKYLIAKKQVVEEQISKTQLRLSKLVKTKNDQEATERAIEEVGAGIITPTPEPKKEENPPIYDPET